MELTYRTQQSTLEINGILLLHFLQLLFQSELSMLWEYCVLGTQRGLTEKLTSLCVCSKVHWFIYLICFFTECRKHIFKIII